MIKSKISALTTDIASAKEKLIKKASEIGIYENFGQKELKVLKDRYIDISASGSKIKQIHFLLENFDKWCQTYTG